MIIDYIIFCLARNFTCLRQVSSFLTPIPILAWRFAYPARPKACDKRRRTFVHQALSTGRRTRPGCKYTAKMKTKPKQSHSKPFFQTPNPVFGPISKIFDKFRQTFLCKTKPFFSKIQIKNKGLTAVSLSSAGVYPVPTSRPFRKVRSGAI